MAASVGSLSNLSVEQNGIEAISDTERYGCPRDLFWPLLAAGLSFFPASVGVFVVGLGLSWWQATIAVVAGLALSYPLVGLVAVAGTRGGAPTMTLSRAAFGYHGNKLPVLMNYCSALGWEGISLALATLTTRTVLKRLGPQWDSTAILVLSYVLVTAATVAIAFYGHDLVMRVQKWITIALAASTAIYFALVLPKLSFSLSTHAGPGSIVAGVTLVMAGGGLARGTVAADYSRYLPRSSSRWAVMGWMSFGAALAPAVLLLFGVMLTTADPGLAHAVAHDPIGALADQLPTWFLIPFLLTTVLSVIAAGVINMYSAGLMVLALGLRIPRHRAVLIDALAMIAGGTYLVFLAPTFFGPFQAFLTVIAVGKSAFLAIFLTDYWMYRRGGYATAQLNIPNGIYGRFNPSGVCALSAGTVVGLGLVTSKDPLIGTLVGYLLTPAARSGSLGASNIGVLVAFLIAGPFYIVLSRTIFLPSRAGREEIHHRHRSRRG